MRGHLLRLGDHLRGVQQRLGRDAADVEADTAQPRLPLDQHDLMPRSAARKAARISARPGAEHQHLGVDVAALGHGGRAAGDGAAAACSSAGAASLVRSSRMGCPSETVSPTFTLTATTVPAAGAGTSMVALSDSRVISGSSTRHGVAGADVHLDDRHGVEVADIWDADLDLVVNTARASRNPSSHRGSGCPLSCTCSFGGRPGCALGLHDHERRCPGKPCRRPRPATRRRCRPTGAGTSIVALSDSRVTSGSSTVTASPATDVDLDHRHVAEVADVGDRNLDMRSCCGSSRPFRGEAGGRLRGGRTDAG